MHAVLALAALVLAGCSSQAVAPAPAPAPETKAAAAKVDLNAIFPEGKGRELVLNNCTTCHTIVPIVILQMSREAWQRNSRDHRERVTALSEADFKLLYAYLEANFNPNRPVPTLPRELLDTWTSY